MKNGIGFKNLKVFKDKFYFEFKDITLLTGVNNSGKSGTINALQLLQENILSGNLDGLLKTEFKTIKNKNKHGSIKSFINNESNLENNYFNIYQLIDKIEYRFRIEINNGLEPFGKISHISAFHTEQKIEIFNIAVLTPYGENFSCQLNINYQYFVDKHRQICLNTLALIKEIPKLKKTCKDLDLGKLKPHEGINYANELMRKFSVYLVIHEATSMRVGDLKEEKKWHFFFTDNNDIAGTDFKFNELGVLFEKNDFLNQKSFNYDLESFNKKYANYLNFGIFDFNKIWEILPERQTEFEYLLCTNYATGINSAYSNFSYDIVMFLSITKWTMTENYSEDPYFAPKNLIENFIKVFSSDFGLMSSLLIKLNKYNNSDLSYNRLPIDEINANNLIDSSDKRYKILNQKGFFDLIKKLAPILLSIEKTQNLLQDFSHDKIFKDINNTINRLHLKHNCTFVSSNRFVLNRTNSFDDGTDLTNLLKELENSNKLVTKNCYVFINKWLKEFDIAEEIKLIPDEDTGNFKIYLKQKKKNILLADYGLGTNQLLPIIFSLCLHKYDFHDVYEEKINSKTVVIEEPEANLHPSMQSKLAEMFIEATQKFNVKIIAETHSEYLIRKLQYLVAKNESKISNNDIVIYYFYKPSHTLVKSKKVKQVEKIEIDKFGRLSKEFGGGFYDEADKISLDLFLLNQYNFN